MRTTKAVHVGSALEAVVEAEALQAVVIAHAVGIGEGRRPECAVFLAGLVQSLLLLSRFAGSGVSGPREKIGQKRVAP